MAESLTRMKKVLRLQSLAGNSQNKYKVQGNKWWQLSRWVILPPNVVAANTLQVGALTMFLLLHG
jgi:hypothetical protein